jgi:hypothetical protein
MRLLNLRSSIIGIAAVIVCAISAASLAQEGPVTLTATLNGTAEVPAVDTEATGNATVTWNPGTMTLTWNVTYSNLSGPAVSAFFHGPAAAGATATAVKRLSMNVTSPLNGSTTLSAAQATQLLSGQWYINISTNAHPTGEIRGQLARQ